MELFKGLRPTSKMVAVLTAALIAVLALFCGTPVWAGDAKYSDFDAATAAAVRSGSFGDAVKLLEKRAKSGDREAQYQLASLYRSGRGVAADDAIALKWMRAAADQGHAKAQYSMGKMFVSGRGTIADIAAGKVWLQKAAAQGHLAVSAC